MLCARRRRVLCVSESVQGTMRRIQSESLYCPGKDGTKVHSSGTALDGLVIAPCCLICTSKQLA